MGLFDNIFAGSGGGLFSGLTNPQFDQPSNPQFRDPRDLLTALSAFFGPSQSPQFSDPRTAIDATTNFLNSPQNPRLRGPIMQTMPNVTDAQYPPQLNMTGLTPQSGDESAGLNMSRPDYGTAQAQPSAPDPWAGIRGVNEQPPYVPGGQQASMPIDARPTSGPIPPQLSQQVAPQPTPQPDFGDRLGAGFMGFANAGSPMQALGNLISGLATGQRSDPQGMQQQQLQSTYKALVARGVPQSEAMAATLNPDIMKIVGAKYFDTQAKLQETGTDPISGQKSFAEYRPGQGLTPVGVPGGQLGAGISAPSLLASGVKGIDHSLSGDAYLQQFSPEVRAAVMAYINGDVMPTGNPRNNGISNIAKAIAQKYGQDTGIEVNDTRYAAKRKMQTDLGASSANSMGGILSNGKSAFTHLANYSDKLVDLGSLNGPDIPGGGHLAAIGNYVGNVAFPTSEIKGKIQAANDNALKYGQESTKFYAGTGGGEAERMHALQAMNPQTVSGKEAAAFLQTEKELMLGRLAEKEHQIRDVMGDQYLQSHPVVTDDLRASISKIDANIARLRGQQPDRHPGNLADPLGIR